MPSIIELRTERRADSARGGIILVIEPRQFFRELLCQVLVQIPAIEAVAVSSVEEYASSERRHSSVSVVLLCVPDGKPLPNTATGVVGRADSLTPAPLVILSNERPIHEIQSALNGGVRGFICNTLNVSIAIEALRLVMAGGTFVPASLLEKACGRPSHSGEQVNELTRRQKQVVDAIRKGKPNKIIAYELGMCESTVKVHVRTIMKKLNATNRTHLVHVFDAKYACSSP